MVAMHIKKHGDAQEPCSRPRGKSTCWKLAALGRQAIEATLDRIGSGHGSAEDGDLDRTTSYAVGSAT